MKEVPRQMRSHNELINEIELKEKEIAELKESRNRYRNQSQEYSLEAELLRLKLAEARKIIQLGFDVNCRGDDYGYCLVHRAEEPCFLIDAEEYLEEKK